MADARAKRVLETLIDNYSRTRPRIHTVVTNLGPAGAGDAVDLPTSAGGPIRDSATRLAPELVGATVETMAIDNAVMVNRLLPQRDQIQLLEGSWLTAVATQEQERMLNYIDDQMLANVITIAEAGTVVNLDEGALAYSELCDLEGEFEVTGTPREAMVYVAHPQAIGRLRTLDTNAFVPAFRGSESGMLGIPDVSTFNGIPVLTQASSALLAGAGNDVPGIVLMNRRKTFFATQAAPAVRVVPDPESGGDALQIRSVFGYHTIAGSARLALAGA